MAWSGRTVVNRDSYGDEEATRSHVLAHLYAKDGEDESNRLWTYQSVRNDENGDDGRKWAR